MTKATQTATEEAIMFPIVRDYRKHMLAAAEFTNGRRAHVLKAKAAYDAMTAEAKKQIVNFKLPELPLWVWE